METTNQDNAKSIIVSDKSKKWINLLARFQDFQNDIYNTLISDFKHYNDNGNHASNIYEKVFSEACMPLYNALSNHLTEELKGSLLYSDFKEL